MSDNTAIALIIILSFVVLVLVPILIGVSGGIKTNKYKITEEYHTEDGGERELNLSEYIDTVSYTDGIFAGIM